MSVVIDLNLVCAICLQDGELRSVFDRDDQSELRISDKILKCSELNLDINNKLPDKICSKCHQELTVAFQFWQKCEAAIAVFASIQQEEDALANYELEQQKIKIPSGLKIKRIQPEGKTYILPVHVESIQEVETIEEESAVIDEQCVETVEQTELEEAEHVEEDEVLEEEEDVEHDEVAECEIDQMEAIELEDYYESEEVLEENYDPDVAEIKIETQRTDETKEFDALATFVEQETEIELKPKVFIKEEVKNEDEEHLAEENMPPAEQQMSKRGRGRPKKLNEEIYSEKTSDLPKANKGLKTESKNRLTNPSATKPSVLKPLAVVQKIRKRTGLSPEKPTKICDICGNSYKYQHALNAHMRRHNNVRPFNCEFCEKAFVSAVELRRHMRVHTGHKPYACQYCDRRFSDFGSRIKHERTHTGERPYNCFTCGKDFAYAHVLSVHLRTHTGEKKFKCNQCGKGFTKKAYLKRHMEQHARSPALVKVNAGEISHDPLDGGEMTAIKNVGLEECIFTTEYIEEDEDTRSVASATVIHMNEDQLEEIHENEIEHIDESVETVIEEYPNMKSMKTKKEELSDEDINYA